MNRYFNAYKKSLVSTYTLDKVLLAATTWLVAGILFFVANTALAATEVPIYNSYRLTNAIQTKGDYSGVEYFRGNKPVFRGMLYLAKGGIGNRSYWRMSFVDPDKPICKVGTDGQVMYLTNNTPIIYVWVCDTRGGNGLVTYTISPSLSENQISAFMQSWKGLNVLILKYDNDTNIPFDLRGFQE